MTNIPQTEQLSKSEIQVNFKIPVSTHKKVKILAIEEDTSMNKKLSALIQKGLEANQRTNKEN